MCQGQHNYKLGCETQSPFLQWLFEDPLLHPFDAFYAFVCMIFYRSSPSSLCLVGVPKSFPPGAGASFFKACLVALGRVSSAALVASAAMDLRACRRSFRTDSRAFSPPECQGDSPTVSAKGSSLGYSSGVF